MARDLRLNIQGDSTSGVKAIDKTADALDKANKELRQAEARTDALAVKARKLAEAEERAADKTRDLAAKAAVLRKQIEESGVATADQAKKLDRLTRDTRSAALATDDYRRAAARASAEAREQARGYDRVAANAREAARAVATLGAVSALGPNGKGGGKGGGFGAGVVGLLPSFVGDLLGAGAKAGGAAAGAAGSAASGAAAAGPYGIAAGLGVGGLAALAAGPFVGGVVGGGALLGGASAGAGLGLAGAWQGDPEKFSAMWSESIDSVKKRWIDSSAQFGGPLEDSLKEVDRVLRDLPIERLADASKGFVEPLVQGAGGGITELASGFADFVEAAQPVVDVVGPELVGLGRDVGDALRAIGLGADGGAQALGDLVNGIGYAVKATGIFIMGLEKAYQVERRWITGIYDAATAMPGLGDATKYVVDGLFGIESTSIAAGRALYSAGAATSRFTISQQELADAAKAASEAIRTETDLVLNVGQTTDDAVRATNAFKESLKENGNVLDGNSEKALNNRDALREAVRAYEEEQAAAVAAANNDKAAIDRANAAYIAHLETLRNIQRQAGANTAAIDAMIESAKRQAGLIATYYIRVRYDIPSRPPGLPANLGTRYGGDDRFADGGVVGFSGAKLVGERGPELAWLNRGQYVSTAEETRKLTSMMGSGSAGGSGAARAVDVRVMPGGDAQLGALVQYLFDRGLVQLFDRSGGQISTRP